MAENLSLKKTLAENSAVFGLACLLHSYKSYGLAGKSMEK
jgi:hypothetical protein